MSLIIAKLLIALNCICLSVLLPLPSTNQPPNWYCGWLGLESHGDTKGLIHCKATGISAVLNENLEIMETANKVCLIENMVFKLSCFCFITFIYTNYCLVVALHLTVRPWQFQHDLILTCTFIIIIWKVMRWCQFQVIIARHIL